MGSRHRVHVCCNDPDCGAFLGKAQGLTLDFGHGDYIELGMVGAREPAFRVDAERVRFRLGRIWYPFEASATWVGNWCWNAYTISSLTASKLVFDLMRDKRWRCEGGPVDACNAYEEQNSREFMTVWHACLWPPSKAMVVGSDGPPEAPKEQD